MARRLAALTALLASTGCAECCSDYDCLQLDRPGALCVEGACTVQDPTDVAIVTCDADAECAAGERCVEGLCAAAPACQRLEAVFEAADSFGGRGTVTATSDGCEVQLIVDIEGSQVTVAVDRVNLDGTFEGPLGFNTGGFYAPASAGRLDFPDHSVVFSRAAPCFDVSASLCSAGESCQPAGATGAGVCR